MAPYLFCDNTCFVVTRQCERQTVRTVERALVSRYDELIAVSTYYTVLFTSRAHVKSQHSPMDSDLPAGARCHPFCRARSHNAPRNLARKFPCYRRKATPVFGLNRGLAAHGLESKTSSLRTAASIEGLTENVSIFCCCSFGTQICRLIDRRDNVTPVLVSD
jgi:hypothetical protein